MDDNRNMRVAITKTADGAWEMWLTMADPEYGAERWVIRPEDFVARLKLSPGHYGSKRLNAAAEGGVGPPCLVAEVGDFRRLDAARYQIKYRHGEVAVVDAETGQRVWFRRGDAEEARCGECAGRVFRRSDVTRYDLAAAREECERLNQLNEER